MKTGLLVNNLIAGLLLVAVWVYDYHYLNRISKKLSRKTLTSYKMLKKKLLSEDKDRDIVAVDDFYYQLKDTIYVEFYNFHYVTTSTISLIHSLIHEIYSKKLSKMHTEIVYFRFFKFKRNENFAYEKISQFQDAHTQSQNFYYIKFVNADNDNEFKLYDNIVFFNINSERLSNEIFLKQVLGKSLYHLKRLNKLRNWRNDEPKKDLFQKLKIVYMKYLKNQFFKYVDSLVYINENKNLVFNDGYLQEINADIFELDQDFASENLEALFTKLQKRNLDIYYTVYFFEEF